MSAIKRFFEKKKLDVKFKKAGAGHKLTEKVSARPSSSGPVPVAPPPRHSQDPAQRRAAEAALARIQSSQSGKPGLDPMRAVKNQARAELMEERRQVEAAAAAAGAQAGPKVVEQDHAPMVSSVLFACPEVTEAVLPKAQMETHIEEFLLASLADDPEMTSALMIHTLNKDQEKVKVCVETLCKYLDNIINNPAEEKFRKIRLSNKAFQERVAPLRGHEEFMQAAGFYLTQLPVEDREEDYLVMPQETAADVERLKGVKEVLLAAEPLRPTLYRDTKVFHPSSKPANRFDVPNEFYNISTEELKKEQQRREEAVEKLGMLRTKAMRERDQLKELRKYRYTLVRVRFPDGYLLQGVFRATERLSALEEFVRGCLAADWVPFTLTTATGQELKEEASTLAELGLAPAVLLNFAFDPTVVREVAAQHGKQLNTNFLSPELVAAAQDL